MASCDLSRELPKRLTREGEAFLRPIADFGAYYLFERSCKFVAGAIEPERFLATLPRIVLGADARDTLTRSFNADAWPRAARSAIDEALVACCAVHFGFEVSRGRIGHKIYFEYSRSDLPVGCGERAELVHRAFKWRPGNADSSVETHYILEPSAGRSLARRIDDVFEDGAPPAGAHVGIALAGLSMSRAPNAELELLAVREPGLRRRSFDLQLYDAGLRVGDAIHALRAQAPGLMMSPDRISETLSPVSGARLGHVAAGLDRDGASFATLYYAPERR